MNVRTRFAPSPTGFLHVGSARTALYAWLFARQNNGAFVLRIEDTDKEREVEGAIGHIQQSLKWLGLDWDEGIDTDGAFGPYIQSERLATYRKFAQQLVANGFAYPDPYSSEEVEAFRTMAAEEKRPFLFRDHRPETFEEWDGSKPLRFCVPEIKRYEWNDIVFGELSAGEEALDDFILMKSDGFPTYNFAHVVDDITMEITHIMRGQEFIASTPKFLSLYDALDHAAPLFATLPPILGEGGNKKLSKRDGAQDVLDYRKDGYLPEALCNYLALLGWHPAGEQEVLTLDELVLQFDLSRVQKSGAQWDDDKLDFINQQHMRMLSDDEYAQKGEFEIPSAAQFKKIIPLLKERAHTFAEAREMLNNELAFVYEKPILTIDMLTAKETATSTQKTGDFVKKSLVIVRELPENLSIEEAKAALMVYGDTIPKEEGGRGAFLWPLRYALSGQERSPDPFTIIYILGRDESISRIEAALAILGE